ncbi:hypothetical protein [Paenibacillus thalictri]|uniref:Uncharacterized protein n=1 Tax=Paenibacillus thalictri TaxID=2527873 RepID=A0A4Q9DTA7_9BACL|nr:hypothetical protein [Paenibacillus thalictri]TBL78592.1 hypothetical protein EYB31_13910 [Paenibacillus thalictri]
MEPECILVSAPTKAGERFICELLNRHLPVAAMTNSKAEAIRLKELGVKTIIIVDTMDQLAWKNPKFPVGQVYLFERSFTLCCRYIQICRSWTSKPICVVTDSDHARLVYKSLGAAFVVHSRSEDVSFLIPKG